MSWLRGLQGAGGVAWVGMLLVLALIAWLAVNLYKEPSAFVSIGLEGLTLGLVYGLVALGYSLVYGILELINFAHGDVFMLGSWMSLSVAGQPNENLGPTGKKFVQDFGATQAGGQVDPYSAYAAQSAEVLLTAIEKSDGTRADVATQLLQTKVTDGIIGSFQINENGDTNANPVTMYLIKGGKQTTYKVITPPEDLVKKA